MALSVGDRLGHYDVTALIGSEGMGQVYRATDRQLHRDVALKILPDAFAADPDPLARFQREAKYTRTHRGCETFVVESLSSATPVSPDDHDAEDAQYREGCREVHLAPAPTLDVQCPMFWAYIEVGPGPGAPQTFHEEEGGMRQEAGRFCRPVLWVISLAIVVAGLSSEFVLVDEVLAQAPQGGQQPAAVGRLNKIIENAELGKISFNGESWRMMPDNEHNIFGVIELQRAMAENRPEGSERFLLPAVVRMNMEANHLEKHRIKQYLDAGLMGLILSQSETLDQVREFIKMMRYPPQGQFYAVGPRGVRGWAPTAATRYWGVDMDTYMRKADLWPLNPDGELLALVLLETKSQMENIEELLELPGLGGVLFGTADMSMSYGVGTPAPPADHPIIMANIERFARACAAHHARGGKVICGAYQTPQGLATAVEQGLTMFTSARGDFRGDAR